MSTDRRRAFLVVADRAVSYRVWATDEDDAIEVFLNQSEADQDVVEEHTFDLRAEPEDNNPTQGDGQR